VPVVLDYKHRAGVPAKPRAAKSSQEHSLFGIGPNMRDLGGCVSRTHRRMPTFVDRICRPTDNGDSRQKFN
jgi:hypothetical protein